MDANINQAANDSEWLQITLIFLIIIFITIYLAIRVG